MVVTTPSLQPSQAPFPKPSPPDTPEALLSPILRRRSSTSESRAAPGAGALRRGGGAALGAWEEPPAGGAVGEAGGCAPSAGAKGGLKFLYVRCFNGCYQVCRGMQSQRDQEGTGVRPGCAKQ